MAKVPVIPPLSSISDPNTRSVLQAMQDQQRVRSGEVGDGSEKFLTVADLSGAVSASTARQIASRSTTATGVSGAVSKAVEGAVSGIINAVQDAVVNSRFWKDLTSRLSVVERPEWFSSKFKTAVTVEQTTRQKADLALSNQITTVFANLDGNIAGVRSELEAVVTDTEALATSTTTALTELGGNMASAQNQITSLTTQTNSVAGSLTTLQTTVGTAINTASQAFNIATSVDGVVDGSWVTKFDVNGYVTGFGLGLETNAGKTPKSTFAVLADNFVIGHPSATDTIPFQVSGGKTYIKQALIGAAAIDTLRIANHAVTIPSAWHFVGSIAAEETRWIYFSVNGLDVSAGEKAPLHIHIGLYPMTYATRIRVYRGGFLSDDVIAAGEHGYLAILVELDSNNTFGYQIILEAAGPQIVRLSAMGVGCKR